MRGGGYIKLSRKMFDGHDPMWDDGTEFDMRSAWIDLIQLAAYAPHNYRGTDLLERGEFVAAVRYLAERWKWSKSRVQRWLKNVEQMGRIKGQRMGQHGRVYAIVNYDIYQSVGRENGTVRGTDSGGEMGQSWDKVGTNKKAVKTKKESSGGFAAVVYDRLQREWESLFGPVKLAYFRSATLPALTSGHRAGQIARAMKCYRAECDRSGRPAKLAWFFDDIHRWVREADACQVDVFPADVFCMTAEQADAFRAEHIAQLVALDAQWETAA